MTLEFLCPSGHKIVCPDAHAGRGAKCPKCGVQFRIPPVAVAAQPIGIVVGESGTQRTLPTAERIQRDAPHAASSGDSHAANGSDTQNPTGQVQSASGSGILDSAPDVETIEFLCPQGHRLTGPARLQGHPGKCPHCGTRFLVPMVNTDDDDADDSGMLNVEFGEDDGIDWDNAPISRVASDSSVARHYPSSGPALGGGVSLGGGSLRPTESASGTDGSDIARLFLRLWQERDHGGTVEVHITGGAVLVPQWFDRQMSSGTHAAFATQAADGSITLTTVSWESVTRVVVRGVQGLPDGYE